MVPFTCMLKPTWTAVNARIVGFATVLAFSTFRIATRAAARRCSRWTRRCFAFVPFRVTDLSGMTYDGPTPAMINCDSSKRTLMDACGSVDGSYGGFGRRGCCGHCASGLSLRCRQPRGSGGRLGAPPAT